MSMLALEKITTYSFIDILLEDALTPEGKIECCIMDIYVTMELKDVTNYKNSGEKYILSLNRCMEEMPYVINYIKSLRIKSGRLFRHKKTEYIEILDQMVHFAQRFTEESHKDSPDETVLIGSLALWYENLTKAKLSFQKKK